MKRLQRTEVKVGLFALIVLIIIIYATIRVSQEGGILARGSYHVYAIMDSAVGLTPKTPVEIAGIQVGAIGTSELIDQRAAKVELNIKRGVKLTKDVVAQVRTKGFLGESYIGLQQGDPEKGFLEPGDTITATNPYADVTELSTKMHAIADDVSEMTSAVKKLFKEEDGRDAPITEMVHNMRDFTKDLKDFSHANKGDMDRIVSNLAALTNELRVMVQENRGEFTQSMGHIRNIARKIDEGRGTLGRLVNDETTIDNLNRAVENLNETLGGVLAISAEYGLSPRIPGELRRV